MQLGMIGLGRMGGNMAKRIAAAGHEVVGYDRSPESDRTVASLKELVAALKAPRLVWVMVPAGEATDSTINELAELLQPGDMIIDGGNSRYTDDARHAAELEPKGIHFMDCGVSGGVWGIDRGYALMVGGKKDDFETARPIFEALKPEGDSGLVLAGPVGGGHFTKMVHNGIEYGMMQAFGEGFATMVKSDLVEDPAAVMSSWRDGSVVQSWLLDLLAIAFKSDPTLKSMPPVANESGEAKWMIEAALELGVPTPATAAALYARQTSRGGADDILRVVSTMRAQFGGHVTKIDEIIGTDGRVSAIKIEKMELGEPDASGRRSPIVIEGSEFDIPMDCVIMSLGTSPNPLLKATTPGLETQKRGQIIADEHGLTSIEGVYAGGDAVKGAETGIRAPQRLSSPWAQARPPQLRSTSTFRKRSKSAFPLT